MVSTDRRFGAEASKAVKAPVVAATTANITLSGVQTVDGVSLAAEDRVLVKDQTTGSENGVYIVSASAWVRAPDFNGTRDVVGGTRVFVARGSANAGLDYYVSNTGAITIGATALTFAPANQAPADTISATPTPVTATAGQTSVTASYTIGAALVFVNGLLISADDYTATSGTAVVFDEGLNAGDMVVVVSLSTS